MKRFAIAALLTAGVCLWTACPPQNPTAHSATAKWKPGAVYSASVNYRLYKSSDCVSYSLMATVPQGTTTATDTNVVSGQRYCYVVAAYDSTSGLEGKAAPVMAVIP